MIQHYIPFADDQNLRRLAVDDLCEYLEPKLKPLGVVSEAQPTNIAITCGEPKEVEALAEPKVIEHQD